MGTTLYNHKHTIVYTGTHNSEYGLIWAMVMGYINDDAAHFLFDIAPNVVVAIVVVCGPLFLFLFAAFVVEMPPLINEFWLFFVKTTWENNALIYMATQADQQTATKQWAP